MNPLLKFGMQQLLAKGYLLLAVLLIIGAAGGAFAFTGTFLSGMNVLLGFCLLPFTIFFQEKQRINYFYLMMMILFAVLAFAYSVRMFYFFMLAFYFLLTLERFVGKVNPLILFLFAFMSPFFQQVSVILGFPIRLQLSQWAGNILDIAGWNVQVEGNTMLMNGSVFEVDEACMGLSMLATSLLMGVAAIAHQYRISGLRLNLIHLISFFSFVVMLNVISNIFRIMLLVIFRVPPENPMHELIGIACLLLYVMVPLYFISVWAIRRFGKSFPGLEQTGPVGKFAKSLFITMAILVMAVGIRLDVERKLPPAISHATVELPNVQIVKMDAGITKLFNRQILVYVKPIPEFFTSEHTPLLCWKGSGYQFQRVKKTKVAGQEIYIGQLVKDQDKMFTAWWYSNGKIVTIDQWNWRIRMLKGEEKFSVINVTAKDPQTLMNNIEMIFERHWLTLKKEHNNVAL
jgi:exosortase N